MIMVTMTSMVSMRTNYSCLIQLEKEILEGKSYHNEEAGGTIFKGITV